MFSAYDSLKAGLYEHAAKENKLNLHKDWSALVCLLIPVAKLMEGDEHEKRQARKVLQGWLGRGRCILNAAELAKQPGNEFAAALAKKQQELIS